MATQYITMFSPGGIQNAFLNWLASWFFPMMMKDSASAAAGLDGFYFSIVNGLQLQVVLSYLQKNINFLGLLTQIWNKVVTILDM